MPVEVLWVDNREELSAAVERMSRSGYRCRAEDSGSVVCERRINELMSRTVFIVVRG